MPYQTTVIFISFKLIQNNCTYLWDTLWSFSWQYWGLNSKLWVCEASTLPLTWATLPAQCDFFFLWYWWLSSVFRARWAGTLPLEPHPSPLSFALAIFGIGPHIFAWVGPDHDPLTYAFHIADMTGAHHHTQLLIDMGSHELFAWLPLNHDPPNLCLLSS
jgi:hypothetical protein